ncbi:MAG: hypothetical protein E6G56_08180 [Actinobacteria bacterium]|nr:MAG: hypothetical protein E6G56_08180 [Actinomycetota bacterium]
MKGGGLRSPGAPPQQAATAPPADGAVTAAPGAANGPPSAGSARPRSGARRVARALGVQLGGDALSKVGSLAFYTVMARELGTTGFGNFTFAASVVLVIEVAGLGLDQVVTRDVARERAQVERLFWNVNAIKLALGSVGIAVALAISLLGGYPRPVTVTVGILAVAKLAETLAKTYHAVFRGVEETGPIAFGLIVQRFSTAAVGVAALLAGAGLEVAALTYLGGALLGLAYVSWRLSARGIRPNLRVSLARARRLATESLPIGLSWTFGMLLARLDAVLLSFLKNNTAVGLYGAAYRVFEATLLIGSTFALSALPALSRLDRSTFPSLGQAYELGCKVVALMLFPLSAALMLFPTPITETFFGHAFATSATPMRLLGASTALDGVFLLSVQVIAARGKRRVLLPISAAAVAVNTVLNLILIPGHSFNGAALAMTLTEATLAAVTVLYTLRLTGLVRWGRIVLAPAAGCAAMAVPALTLGGGALGLALAALVYPAVTVLVERRAYPRDLRLMIDSIRWRRVPIGNPLG